MRQQVRERSFNGEPPLVFSNLLFLGPPYNQNKKKRQFLYRGSFVAADQSKPLQVVQ